MATLPFHTIVSMYGWYDDESVHTVALGLAADGSAITAADVGKGMMQDTSAPNQFKLATDGAEIVAYLVSVTLGTEAGATGSVAFRWIEQMPLLASDSATVGSAVVGSVGGDSRGGWVKAAPATYTAPVSGSTATITPPAGHRNFVVEKDQVNSPAQWVCVVKM